MKTNLRNIDGLKFPDEMVTRFFFKSRLDQRTGDIMEVGCGNGCNLALFADYGWNCTGLDIDPDALEIGRQNFSRCNYNAPTFITSDMNDTLPETGLVDVILFANSLCYVHPNRAAELIREVEPRLRPGGRIFVRLRSLTDYRYGKGESLGQHCYRLQIDETSEMGCTMTFYDVDTLIQLLSPFNMDLQSIKVMESKVDNLGLRGLMIRNEDLIVWGEKHA